MSIFQTVKFLFMSSEGRMEYVKRQVEGLTAHQVSHNNDTAFKYVDNGFFLTTKVGDRFYRWLDVEVITAYKADLLTYDDLRLDIDFGEVVLTLSEDVAGWSEFIEMLPKKLLGILIDWESQVILPPFSTNSTVIYRKEVAPEKGS